MKPRLAAAYLLVTLLVSALLLFVPAGTVAWWRGWQFLLVFFVVMTAAALWLWRINPEIYAARRRVHQGTKRWDVVLLCFLLPMMTAILPVAALDDARFHWFPLPSWAIALGYALLLAGVGITVWAQRSTSSSSQGSGFRSIAATGSSTRGHTPSSVIPAMSALASCSRAWPWRWARCGR
jgi:hypothetical protein